MNLHRLLIVVLLGILSALGVHSTASAMTCPSGPEQMAVSIPNPDPPPAAGNFDLNIDGLLAYFASNNITNVKQFIDHFPRILNTHYTIVQTTGALHQTSLTNPGLLVWGDGRFMINMGTTPSDPRYEVVDIAYLKDNGDWQFDAVDFRTSPPTRRGNGECIQCHGTPPRPIWGNYLDWPGMFSDNGLGQEILTSSQASRLTQLRSQAPSSPRFHKIEIPDYLFDQAGSAVHLPEHAYGPGLTISNTEMGAAVGESVQKRAARSARYAGLREEYLALSYCDTYAGVLSSTKKTEIRNLITSLGGTNTGYAGAPHWTDIYRLWGLDPNHEFPLHLRVNDPVGAEDLNWNTGVSRIREVVDQLILWQLGQESSSARSILQGNPASYSMTSCGNLFPTLYQHTQHKIYALHTLRGNARWAARTGNGNSNLGYYDIDYLRIHQAWDYIRSPMCNLLTQTVGTGTIGNPTSNTPPVANFSFTVSGLTVNFSDTSTDSNGTIASRSWNFGDGTTSTAANPSKTYSTAGTRTVTLTVTDNGGATNTVSKSVTTTAPANTPPVANFNFAVSGLTVNFTDTSTDANGTIASRSWNFGDGTTSTAANPTKTYSSAGTRTVILTVTDNQGATNTVSKSVTVGSTNTPPVANFTFTVSNLTVTFTNTSTDADGTIASRSWNFGDGTTSTSTNPTKTYSSAGTRTVTLTVTDNQGATNTVSKSVTVGSTNTPPVANFNFTVSGLTVNFTDTSTDANGTIASRSWNFGDGTTSTATNPTKTYSSAATRTVTLTVTDNGGATNTVSKSVTTTSTTNTPPVANFTFSVNLLTVAFTDTSTDANGTIASRSWNFGDGTTSTAANPSKTYSASGTRTVTLTVTDNGGATNTVSKSVTVSSTAPPPVSALLKGVPRTGLSGATGSKQYFTLHVHGAPPTNLVFRTSGGTGDMDMYVKHGSIPTETDYQCRPFTNGNTETCSFTTVAEGSWYVMLHGYSAYSGLTLSGDYNDNNTTPPPPPPTNPPPGGNVPNACATKAPVFDAPLTKAVAECVTGSPGPGFYRHFYIRLAAADAGKTLTIKMGNGTGNANMLVSTDLGLFPHEEHFAARPDIVFGSTGPTNEETVVVTNAKAGQDYLITLPAVTEHAGISIIATVQ